MAGNARQQIWETFRAESSELLQNFETILLQIENSPQPEPEQIHSLFRAAHTLKSTAGMADFKTIVDFAHILETLLDRVRSGGIRLSAEVIGLLLLCRDHLVDLFEHAFAGTALPPKTIDIEENLRRQLLEFLEEREDRAVASQRNDLPQETRAGQSPPTAGKYWHVSLRFGRDAFRHGLDPKALIAYLRKIGTIVDLLTVSENLPPAGDFDPESCYLGFEIQFDTESAAADIEKEFELFRFDCDVRLLPPGAPLSDFADLIRTLPEGQERAGAMLADLGALTGEELDRVFEIARPGPAALTTTGAADEGVTPAVGLQKTSAFLRIESGKLDNLINLIGELAIAAVNINMSAARNGDTHLLEQASTLNRLIGEARDNTLKLRMVPVGDNFRKFSRFVREVGNKLGKDIRLEISGGETELDKTVMDKIEDPLAHIIRNAIDHGIESAEERRARGKPPQGRLHIKAYHETGSFVIDVEDDGDGIDAERVRARAIERGLMKEGHGHNGREELFGMLFQPGFSTAESVTDLSGRGVGLDVVKKEIEALRGSVTVKSESGAGTTFSIRLPLTLAIIDGFLVGVGDSSCIIPLDQLVECLTVSDADRIDGRRNCINLRGEVLPFIDLGDLFDIDKRSDRRQSIAVVQYGDLRTGLLVDDLFGEFQAVIKPLGNFFQQTQGISGMSILGEGGIGFILDVPALVQMVARRETGDLDRRERAAGTFRNTTNALATRGESF